MPAESTGGLRCSNRRHPRLAEHGWHTDPDLADAKIGGGLQFLPGKVQLFKDPLGTPDQKPRFRIGDDASRLTRKQYDTKLFLELPNRDAERRLSYPQLASCFCKALVTRDGLNIF